MAKTNHIDSTRPALISMNEFTTVRSTEEITEELIADGILHAALRAPLKQIMTNAGLDADNIMNVQDIVDDTNGFDVKNEKYGDMYKMGVIDPLKVTKNALINATSVATTILSTNAIITHARA